MDKLLITYLLNKGIQLKHSQKFVSTKDIEEYHDVIEPIINGVVFSKGKFTNIYNEFGKINSIRRILDFDNKDIIPLKLLKDFILDEPQLNKEYRIMYYTNIRNEIILLNYELT